MSKRTTIWISDQAEGALGPVKQEEGDSLSGRINSILIRYDQIRVENCPELPVGEWCAICDANNGAWLQAESGENDPARYAWMNVADSDELDLKWGIDRLDLARRMKAMPISQQCAVIEVVGRFWRLQAGEGEGYAELLRRCGAKVLEGKNNI